MRKSQLGFSLIELMIALVLGLVLSAGIIQVFIANRQSQRIEQSVARVQENGRIALDIITQDLRMAGYAGCSTPLKDKSAFLVSDNFINHANAVHKPLGPFEIDGAGKVFTDGSILGFRNNGGVWAPAFPNDLAGKPMTGGRAGSDVVVVYYGEDIGARLNASVPAGSAASISVKRPAASSPCFAKGDLALISSCQNAELVIVTNTPNCAAANISLQHAAGAGVDANSVNTLSKAYTLDPAWPANSSAVPRILRFVRSAYYVGNSGRTNSVGQPIMSLFRWDNTGATELVEGIEFLRIEFGEKLATNNIRYVSADDGTLDRNNIVSVRVGVLAQSYDSVRNADDTANYTVADQAVVHSGGRTLRQAYTATVNLRNLDQ